MDVSDGNRFENLMIDALKRLLQTDNKPGSMCDACDPTKSLSFCIMDIVTYIIGWRWLLS